MEGVKIYGLCLERLRHQIKNAKERTGGGIAAHQDPFLLECYNTGEPEDIIDILELYDVQDRTREEVNEKRDDLAYTVSELVRETLLFYYTEEGHLGLYLALHEESAIELQEAVVAV